VRAGITVCPGFPVGTRCQQTSADTDPAVCVEISDACMTQRTKQTR